MRQGTALGPGVSPAGGGGAGGGARARWVLTAPQGAEKRRTSRTAPRIPLKNAESREPFASAWLLEHSAARVEITVRVLLEDALAPLAVERVVLALVPDPDGMLAERLLADDAARLGH